MHWLFLRNEVEGTTHLCQGQEAVAGGVCDVLEAGEYGRRHLLRPLPWGSTKTALLAELLGRVTRTNGGRGGSMNVTSLEWLSAEEGTGIL